MRETWKAVSRGRYLVSSRGRVKPGVYRVPARRGEMLRQSVKSNGYLQVTLCSPGRRISALVHRLVARAFLGRCRKGVTVNHIDGDKKNNAAANLEYLSHKENVRHAARMGLRAVGARHGMAKLTDAQVRRIRGVLKTGKGQTETARLLGYSTAVVHQIATGKTWKHLK